MRILATEKDRGEDSFFPPPPHSRCFCGHCQGEGTQSKLRWQYWFFVYPFAGLDWKYFPISKELLIQDLKRDSEFNWAAAFVLFGKPLLKLREV